MWRRYLLWFAHEHVNFRYAEIQSITSMFNIPVNYIEKPNIDKPYWIIELETEEHLKRIASRSVLIKYCIELWSHGKTELQLHNNLKRAIKNKSGKGIIVQDSYGYGFNNYYICTGELIEACCDSTKSFNVDVNTFCKHFTMDEKIVKIENFSYLPLKGPVKLKNPDVTLCYFEFYGIDPNNVPEQPDHVFFGRWIADGQRDLIQQYSLKKRQFIGNTSMDAQLSLIMANQAQIRSGDVFFDPFVGSGSLLVAAGHFGAYVWGSDIDYMMLHGRTRPTRVGQKERKRDESIRGNMRQYGIESQYIDVLVSDFSLPMWRNGFKFDAIVTDPPYGVREPTEKIGIERDNYTLSDEHLINHIPSKVEYALPLIYRDLLNFAARNLEMRRRLVFWYPLVRTEYSDDQLPHHPCLQLVGNSEQVLTKNTARRLLTYEKIIDDVTSVSLDLSPAYNFREKFFTINEMSRKERKEKKRQN